MAEDQELKVGSRNAPPAPSGGKDTASPGLRGILAGDRTIHRAVTYWFSFLLLFVLSVGPFGSQWVSGPEIHLILESSGTLLALVVGALALVRFYSKRGQTYLLIGTGFLGTGVLDLFHAGMSATVWARATPLESVNWSAWSFSASGGFLSLFLFVSWLAWRRKRKGEEGGEISELAVYLTAAVVTALVFLLFFLFPTTQAVYPEKTLAQPAELFPALFFSLALLGYLAKGQWRIDGFEHWLVLSLILSVVAHGGLMAFAGAPYTVRFDLSHLLKVLSYACVMAGLLSSVYTTFRREEEAAEAARAANAALAREIDTRRRAERVLQESEEQLQDFLDNAHDLIQSMDPQGRLLYVNRAWQQALGYTENDLEDLNFFDLLDDSCRARCISQFQSIQEGAGLPFVEVGLRARDGRIVSCSGSANVRFQDGKAVATRAIFRDISESLEARKELEAFQANLQALVENTGDAIWSVNRSLQLITFNTAFSMALEARTGREPRTSEAPEQVFPAEDAVWYREMYQRALRGEAFSEFRDEEIGGQIRSYELFFNPIREAMGITGVAVFGKDVTARRRTQLALRMAKEEAERANQAKSHFLANMSHELRTPLNSVIGFTNILLKNRAGHLEEKELSFLDRISANGRHLLELINEVLDLAKIEAGRMELELQSVDLQVLIAETLAQMEGQIRDKPLVLQTRIPQGLPAFETDPGKLKQILINLVGNALKFTESGEVTVEVSTLSDGSTISAIRVRDTGIGIPSDRLHAIFEAFQQADGTTSRKYGGTGLGLTISRSLCQLMGYDLAVESVVDQGSTFSILITGIPQKPKAPEDELIEEALRPIESSRPRQPVADPRQDTPDEPGPGAPPPPSRKVLVIDDDPDSQLVLEHHLEDMGCEVVAVLSAGEGFQQAREWQPDLIILDLMMPGISGWQALRQLKEDPDLRPIPVVVVSLVAGEGERAQLVGAVDLLAKPVEREDLMKIVERNLSPDRNRVALVVDDDPDAQTVLKDYLEEAGLRVVLAAGGREAEARMDEGRPDLVLLDLVMSEMDGLSFLNRIRERKDGFGLPVIVCTAKELSREERGYLQLHSSGIVPKGRQLEQDLREMVSRFFPIRGSGSP